MQDGAVDYKALEGLRANELQDELNRKLTEKTAGGMDSLGHTILKYVVDGNYDHAKTSLEDYVGSKNEYPSFAARATPYMKHSRHLIDAIRAKRQFRAMAALSMAKQQEIFEKVMDHFDELKQNLKKIESTERDAKLGDLRSTVWVVKAFFHGLFALLIVGLVSEVFVGLAGSFNVLLDDIITKTLNTVFSFF